ncbi:3-hydroxybutyryl-CoA dehydrogenase [Rudaeicoccus suwonensis]|uniref:3-hydroxybutyryl-CoA dehydrogenase n=1 Tax=Rudaeicoccus suwonensis TaxID=657409 RepID=A0A561DXA6_9MICO|nr:3-hydroxybutyryl-CoA dehydrogenase [Rudaeicoccus suwonensis]TWE07962.1 3-hydroxybutyryl-CoA dehydrogenase [Rudaeicoccus suwonensis]
MTPQFRTVAVIGLGTMGAGIVEVFAKAGLQVYAVDGSDELAQRGRGFVTTSLGRAVSKGKLEQTAADEVLGRITFTSELTDLADADLVIEAVPEKLEIKQSIFSRLDEIVSADAVLASNTSSLSLTRIAAGTKHPRRVVGMHFFNPAPVLALVEVITTLLVSQEVVDGVRDLAIRLGKKPVVVGDRAGFVANALLITYLARAIRLYENGRVSREDLDNAGRIGIGLPMGPLTLSDLIGLDVVKEVCDVLYAATKRPSDAPPALLTNLVTAGRLGRKTGHGFYEYDKPGSGTVADRQQDSAGAAVGVVAVVGSGELADAFAQVLGGGGLDVRIVSDPGTDTSGLVEAGLVVLAGSENCCEDCNDGECLTDATGGNVGDDSAEQGCGCCGGAAPGVWFPKVVEALSADAIVLAADPASRWAAEDLDVDSDSASGGSEVAGEAPRVMPVRLHQSTRGGQVAELGRGLTTSATALAVARATLEAAGLTVVVAQDRPGLVVDALLFPHLNDAVAMLDSGYATAEDIDTAMSAGCGYPTGPFAMLDAIGADAVADSLLEQAGVDPAVAPNPLLLEHALAQRTFR